MAPRRPPAWRPGLRRPLSPASLLWLHACIGVAQVWLTYSVLLGGMATIEAMEHLLAQQTQQLTELSTACRQLPPACPPCPGIPVKKLVPWDGRGR